jgi:hypothetical protein
VPVSTRGPDGVSPLSLISPPGISPIQDWFIKLGTTNSSVGFTLADDQVAASDLVVSATSSNQGLVLNSNLAIGGSGANRTVVITPIADQSGVTYITVTANNSYLSTSETFLVRVSNDLTLQDGILFLRVLNDTPTVPGISAGFDVNLDGRIGLEEAIYILQVLAGMRP